MVRITEELIRKRSEHNEGMISTLRELTLHQFEIEKIELVQDLCKKLQILFFQNNLISRIENVHKLKELQYLNLALNNITRIEGLSSCESLRKLDLTVNFVDDLLSVEELRDNYNLKELYLTGNPCTDLDGYRDFVIATLPQLQSLDGAEIERTERIVARQRLDAIRQRLVQLQSDKEDEEAKGTVGVALREGEEGGHQKAAEKATGSASEAESAEGAEAAVEDVDPERKDVAEPYTRESRTRMYKEIAAKRDAKDQAKAEEEAAKAKAFINKASDINVTWKDGKVMQTNIPQIPFKWSEPEDHSAVTLELGVSKFLDTSLMDVDVQPTHVRVVVKGAPIVLRTPVEVQPDSSSARRAITNGALLITMPKVDPGVIPAIATRPPVRGANRDQVPDSTISGASRGAGAETLPYIRGTDAKASSSSSQHTSSRKGERSGLCDYRNIVKPGGGGKRPTLAGSESGSDIDEAEVPDLE